jgi:hypothetical protein
MTDEYIRGRRADIWAKSLGMQLVDAQHERELLRVKEAKARLAAREAEDKCERMQAELRTLVNRWREQQQLYGRLSRKHQDAWRILYKDRRDIYGDCAAYLSAAIDRRA